MARVTKLGVYEEQFDEFAEGVSDIPKLLQSVRFPLFSPLAELRPRSDTISNTRRQGSESPVKKTDIIKRVGTLHQFRQKLNLEDENLLDEPEFLWEDAALHGEYPLPLASSGRERVDYVLTGRLANTGLYSSVCSALEFETRLT
jgi:hypothetical protein